MKIWLRHRDLRSGMKENKRYGPRSGGGRGSALGCGRQGLFLLSALRSLSDSLWLMNSLSSQDSPQSGAQLRGGSYIYMWLLEMPVLIIIKKKKIPSQ